MVQLIVILLIVFATMGLRSFWYSYIEQNWYGRFQLSKTCL